MKSPTLKKLQWLLNLASLAIIVTFVLSFKSPEGNQSEQISISAQVANEYFNRYFDNANTLNEKPKGFTISRAQYESMSNLLQNNPALSGFRVYYGVNASNVDMAITVGTDMTGDVTESIYATARSGAGFCPSVCDNTSSIISAE